MDLDSEKNPRFWLNFQGSTLKAYFGKRATYYEDRARYYASMASKVPKVQKEDEAIPEDVRALYSNTTVDKAKDSLEDAAKAAQRHAKRFRLYETHIDTDRLFLLTENDVDRLELVHCI